MTLTLAGAFRNSFARRTAVVPRLTMRCAHARAVPRRNHDTLKHVFAPTRDALNGGAVETVRSVLSVGRLSRTFGTSANASSEFPPSIAQSTEARRSSRLNSRRHADNSRARFPPGHVVK